MTERLESDGDFLEVLSKRQSQHLEFFKALEDIRWKFTSALGVGALSALFVVSPGDASATKAAVGVAVVVALSMAAIITQVRIYALVTVIWKRILILQQAEAGILQDRFGVKGATQQAFMFPRLGVFNSTLLHMFSVGMTSCGVFSLIIGIATALMTHKLTHSYSRATTLGGVVAVLCFVSALVVSRKYMRAVEATDESFTSGNSAPNNTRDSAQHPESVEVRVSGIVDRTVETTEQPTEVSDSPTKNQVKTQGRN